MNGGGVPDSQKCVPSSYHSVDAYGLMSLWLATTGGIRRQRTTPPQMLRRLSCCMVLRQGRCHSQGWFRADADERRLIESPIV